MKRLLLVNVTSVERETLFGECVLLGGRDFFCLNGEKVVLACEFAKIACMQKVAVAWGASGRWRVTGGVLARN